MKRLTRLFYCGLILFASAMVVVANDLEDEPNFVTTSQNHTYNTSYQDFVGELPVALPAPHSVVLPAPHFFYDSNFVKEVTDPVFIQSLKWSTLIAAGLTVGITTLFSTNRGITDPEFFNYFRNVVGCYLISFYFSLSLVHPVISEVIP